MKKLIKSNNGKAFMTMGREYSMESIHLVNLITKEDLAQILRDFQASRDEVKSKDRDEALSSRGE